MFLAKGFEGEKREAQFGGPMAVFVFEAVEGLQHAREVATVLFGDLVRALEFDRECPSAGSRRGLVLEFAHLAPKVMVGAEFVLLLRNIFQAAFEIRVINGINEDGEKAGKVFGADDCAEGIICARGGKNLGFESGGVEQGAEIVFRAGADLPGVRLAFLDDAEETEFRANPHSDRHEGRCRESSKLRATA